jgi:hypothetical protein
MDSAFGPVSRQLRATAASAAARVLLWWFAEAVGHSDGAEASTHFAGAVRSRPSSVPPWGWFQYSRVSQDAWLRLTRRPVGIRRRSRARGFAQHAQREARQGRHRFMETSRIRERHPKSRVPQCKSRCPSPACSLIRSSSVASTRRVGWANLTSIRYRRTTSRRLERGSSADAPSNRCRRGIGCAVDWATALPPNAARSGTRRA